MNARPAGLEAAVAYYHALLDRDARLAHTCAEMLAERQRRGRLTYGGRPLCKSPAGIAYEDGLSQLFLDLPVMREFGRVYRVSPLYARDRLVEVLLDAYRQFRRRYAGDEHLPRVAIVDWRGLPTATEFELCKE